MLKFAQCGTGSYYRPAMAIAITDIIFTSVILILFVLGSSLMVAFVTVGSGKNATRVLDEITDEVLGTRQPIYTKYRVSKDVAEDMGVFLIVMFLTMADFVIACIFINGVKSKNPIKCQVWFNIRLVTFSVFTILVIINLVYGSSWYRCIPDAIFTLFRAVGLIIGYVFLKEIRGAYKCKRCVLKDGAPVVIIDEHQDQPALPTTPQVTRKISPGFLQVHEDY